MKVEPKGIIEAILFASPSPVSIDRLKRISGLKKGNIEHLINEINRDYAKRAYTIIRVNKGFQIVTRPEYEKFVSEVRGNKVIKLSPQALETLAIVFKEGPITRQRIEDIRGLDSSHTLTVLLEWGLIRVKGKDGFAFLYQVTPYFYDYFKIEKI